MIVIGGVSASVGFRDVWALRLDGAPEWSEITPPGPVPSSWSSGSAIFDPIRDRVVLFGGYGAGPYNDQLLKETWALSLSSGPSWIQLTPAGTGPSERFFHSASYDPIRDRMVVFGGHDGSGSLRNDLWALSLAGAPTWSSLSPSAPLPRARRAHTSIYDPVRDQLVVYGGYGGAIEVGPRERYLFFSIGYFLTDVPRLTLFDLPTPALLSLVSAHAYSDRVELEWQIRSSSSNATIFRSDGGDAWRSLGSVPMRGTEFVRWIDRDVVAGAHYEYRVSVVEGEQTWTSVPTSVAVPLAPAFSLAGADPNPSSGPLQVAFTLDRVGPVQLEVIDIGGRRVDSLRQTFGIGSHQHVFSSNLRAGVYMLRLTQNGRSLTARAIVVR